MSLRYRLFLILSGIFAFIAICSAFMEGYVTRRELTKAQKTVKEKLLALSEKRRIDLQNYFAATIVEAQVRINAVLTNISNFSPQIMRFGPTANNIKKGTWGDAADLLLEYKWIDFLQNSNDGQITAAMMPQSSAVAPTYRIDIDKDLCWIYLGSLKDHPDPYIGISVPYSPSKQSIHIAADGEMIEQNYRGIPSAFLLFEITDLLSTQLNHAPILQNQEKEWSPIPVSWAEGYVLEVEPFVQAFHRVRALLQNKAIRPPEYTPEEILGKMDGIAERQGGLLSFIPSEPLLSSVSSEKMMKKKLQQVSLQYTQINMIWGMIALYNTGMFGNQLFSFPSPRASALFSIDNSVGIGIKTDEVLFSTPLFDDGQYFSKNPSNSLDSALSDSIAVIPVSDHLFLGNTARFVVKTPKEEKVGFLTIASNADLLLQGLVSAIHEAAILFLDSPISAYDANAEKLSIRNQLSLPYSQMVESKSGVIFWRGENYFFLNLKPFPDIGLHLFLLNPEKKEFAFLHDLEVGSQKVVKSILFNMHIAGLIGLFMAMLLLHCVSRRITKPIVQLANATEDVVEGRLDQIKLTLPPLKHNDEIAVLCHSFEEMVKGLQEKEKVKAVLNKVVSREIAQEILKGSVHLGGEEKIVTVLFADIRCFTQLTQNMKPGDIIELLNTCMTKISQIIDKNGGVIDKYVGDEVMALFGAPLFCKDAAARAIRSAIEMVDSLQQWNQLRASADQPAIEIGVGIHTGAMLAGNMGAENRLNYTVIGSNVNLAARLCSAAKRMEILISKETLNEPFVKDWIKYEETSLSAFKGFDQPINVFRVLNK